MKRQAAVVVICAAACSMVAGTLLAFLHPEGSSQVLPRPLTFAERVAYQRAIEDVYWRHRIWPKENPGPKPRLDAVMSQAQLEKKVEDYLRNSQALEDYWQRPIAAEQLQAEMERMAEHTKQPDVLRELFEALGNDPFVIAECLARPVLTERLVADVTVVAGVPPAPRTSFAADTAASTGNRVGVTANLDNARYTLPEISVPLVCTDNTWTATSITNAPVARGDHSAVWTGSEMIIWGGFFNGSYLNSGGRYDPSTDSWTATSTTGAPDARTVHTAVWTGSEMIVWGGYNGNPPLNTGGRYNPITDTWTATSTTNATDGRYYHTAVWTGSEMIVWGGIGGANTGGRYNPGTDSWTATSTTNAPTARQYHTAVWTGSEMIVWGGDSGGGDFNDGGRYNPATDSWTATSLTNAPADRYSHTAVWTGSEMIVWGGFGCDYGGGGTCVRNSGGRYNPSTDSWTPTGLINVPSDRGDHTAVWTDSEMIIWGGSDFDRDWSTGGRYNPGTDRWTLTSLINVPSARIFHTAVWDSSDGVMIVWGGADSNAWVNTGGRYCAQFTGPSPTPTPTCPPNLNILIVHSEHGIQPYGLRTNLLAQPGVSSVDLFDGQTGTPTLAQLLAYQIVVPYLNYPFDDATAMGNVLADYIDGGGVVVGHTYLWGQFSAIDGRYATDGYNPFVIPANNVFTARTLGSCTFAPLCNGVSALNSSATNDATLSPGAVLAATWNTGQPLIAYKTVNGHSSVGVTAYVGDALGTWSGDFAKVIVNAGRWLLPPCGTPTPTPTATATPTPRLNPTPRPRPTPAPRP